MSYTVGLDFGTHQTKVCIENATNPAQKIYEFIEFDDLQGGKSVLLPSIVQINVDDTLSYGFVNDTKCKTISFSTTPKPSLENTEEIKLQLPRQPEKLTYPPRPKRAALKGHSLKEQLIFQKNFDEYCLGWTNKVLQVEEENRKRFEEWELECTALKNDYDYDLEEYYLEKRIKQRRFEVALNKWREDNLPRKQIFRYFKLATFSKQHWQYDIKPEIISVWYLTFVLLKIQEKFGDDFYTQMGVPYSIDHHEADQQKSTAYKILIASNYLISEYKTLDRFLKTKYQELLKNTELFDFTNNDINSYGINVMPEAFAGLTAITQQGKLNRGMHLLSDIGGGTTDIAFFTITKELLPNIHAVISFPHGLNYIFEEHQKTNSTLSVAELQQLFRNSQQEFDNAVSLYHIQLKERTIKMIQQIEKQFIIRQSTHKWEIGKLRDALANRPVVYCGGGSMYDKMRIPLYYFTDEKLIDQELISIPYLKNKNIDSSLFTILATSYGLSIPLEYEIHMTPIENVFEHLPAKESEFSYDLRIEYGLADT